MDLEQFYAADPRRRKSEELEFGTDWQDGGARTEVSWIAATGEVYAMRDPLGRLNADVIGDLTVSKVANDQLTVEVLGVIADRDRISAVMSGWDTAMTSGPDSLGWVRDRIAHADTEGADPPAQPSRDLPAD